MTEPTPTQVVIASDQQEPVPVTIQPDVSPKPVVTPDGTMSLPPTTTRQEDIVTAGQRFTSTIWELTQAAVTVLVTLTVAYTAVAQIESQVINNAFFLIIGFYFSRSNHSAIGGIGRKATDNQPYLGR